MRLGAFASLWELHGSVRGAVKWGLYGVYFLLFLLVWHAGTGIALRPFPEIFEGLAVLWTEKGFAQDIGQSLQLNLIALGVTLLIVLTIAYLAVLPAFAPLAFALSKGRFLGLMGLNAMFIEFFGLGLTMKVAVLTFGISVFYLTSMYSIVMEIPRSKFDHARSLGLSEFQVFWQVVVRGTADQMLEAFRQNAAIGWMMITAVEGIVKAGGIGDRLYHSYKHFHRGEVLAIIFVILLIGLLMDAGLRWLQGVVTPHVLATRRED